MTDLINKIVSHMCYRCHEYEDAHGIEYNCDNCLLSEVIDEIKSINDRPLGEWVDKGEYAECSICGAHSGTQFDGVEPIPLKSNFCPNCGKRMKGGDTE